jgi:hypothetical protein
MSGLTINDPIRFSEVLASQNVIPGDVLHLRGGTYLGNAINFQGTAEAPITVQPYNGEPVIFDGMVSVTGLYTHLKNITFRNTDPTKSTVYITGFGIELDTCDISGAFLGVSWFGSGFGKLINCAFHDTGSYGIYTHNHVGGAREITDCTFTDIGGAYDLHMYSDSANAVRDYTVSGCTFGKLVVSHGSEVTNVKYLNNTFGAQLKLGNGLTVEDLREFVVTGNTFTGASAIRALTCSRLDISQNIFSSETNIELTRGANETSLSIDQNEYTGGAFAIGGAAKTWQEWQAAGYDAAGTYQ